MIKEDSSVESTPTTTIVSFRRRFSYEQTEILLNEFRHNHNPNKVEMEAITSRILHNKNSNSDFKRVNQWYQNRRARENKKRWLRIKNLVTEEDNSDSRTSSQLTPQLDHNGANFQQSGTEHILYSINHQSSTIEIVKKEDVKTALATVSEAFSIIYDDTTTEILRYFQQEFLNALLY